MGHESEDLGRNFQRVLIDEASRQQGHAYPPYSKFRVGAALLFTDGSIVGGCNVENAAYGSTICAERGAIMHAAALGKNLHNIVAVAVIGPAPEPITPCGACRQMLAEFSPPDDPIIVLCCAEGGAPTIRHTLTELLPLQFPTPASKKLLG